MTKKLLSMMLTFVLLVGLLQTQGYTAYAADVEDTEYVLTNINKLVYNLTTSGIEEGTKTSLEVMDGNWSSVQKDIANGTANVTVFENADLSGIKNAGYVYDTTTGTGEDTKHTLENANVQVTVNTITVNDTYEIPVNVTLTNAVNGLPNIWSNLTDGAKVYEGDRSYLAYDAQNSLICFYAKASGNGSDTPDTPDPDTPEETYKAVNIQKLVYTVEASGITKETTFVARGHDYTAKEVPLTNESQDLTISFDDYSRTGMVSLGTIYDVKEGETETLKDTQAVIVLKTITVNDQYEVQVNATLNCSSNGLPNIWSGLTDGQQVYKGTDCYFAYSKASDLICFYIKSEGGSDTPPVDVDKPDGPINPNTKSMQYVKAMGNGWNLGNSLECINTNLEEPDKVELEWGNPRVTRELLHSVKEKGFDNVRIPLTFYRRYTVNETAAEGEYKYIINQDYLDRAKEVINWALDEGFYVMTNIHHDSWLWLREWDGKEGSEEYRMYRDFWGQLAETFKDAPDKLCFETINEYEPGNKNDPNNKTNPETQAKVMGINKAAYEVIRHSGGNNATRMIVMPSYLHNHEQANSSVLSKFITELNDENIIATVHYYSEWVYASNIGKTGFDEPLWKDSEGNDFTPRISVDNFMKTLRQQFLCDGIGVIVSEYGVLGYDTGDNCMQIGEEIKYYDYMNQAARENNVCLMFWDNGSAVNRYTYDWKYERIGAALTKTMDDRISYATGLDTIFFHDPVTEDVQIPLTLNGKQLTEITGLTLGNEYTYADNTVILSKDYVNSLLKDAAYGTLKDLELTFDNGYVWHEYLVYYGKPSYKEAQGTTEQIDIPFVFNGSQVRRITASQGDHRVGPNSDWWEWLQYGRAFNVNYTKGTLSFLKPLFEEKVTDGIVKATVEFYDGQSMDVFINVTGNTVTSLPLSCADLVILYAGEAEIPAQYITAPSGYKIYGIESEDPSMVTMEGQPAVMAFDTKAHDNLAKTALKICYMELENRCDIMLGIKDAPIVDPMSLETGKSGKITLKNLAEDASCTYELSDTSIGTIAEDGTITATKAGHAFIRVTVTQYGRKDTFEAELTVKDANNSSSSGNNNGSSSGNNSSSSGNNSSNSGNNGSSSGNNTGSNSGNNSGNNPGNNNGNGSENNNGNGQPENPQPAKLGTAVETSGNQGVFTVTNADNDSPEVSYTGAKNAVSTTIPSSITGADGIVYRVTSIAKNAFQGNKKLKTVKISSSIERIGANAFSGCKALSKLTIGSSVTKIGSNAFRKCTSLTFVKLPKRIKTIDTGLFYGCTGLKKVTFGNNVTSICNKAFYGCKELSSITIPKNIVKIGSMSFGDCRKLKNISIETAKLTSARTGKNAFQGIYEMASIRVPKTKLAAYTKLLKASGAGNKIVISQL